MSLPIVERSRARRVRASLPPVEPGATARQTYAAMMAHQVTPTLAAWGLQGEGEAFDYPSRVWHLRLGFVPAAWNTASRFQFDVTVLAVTHAQWQQLRAAEPALPQTPEAGQYYAHDVRSGGGLIARLGELVSGDLDRRWTVRPGQDPTPVAAEVLGAVQRHVLPQFAGRAEARPVLA